MPTFVTMTAFFIFALPFIVVSSATLMSKFTDESAQSTIQGMRPNITLTWRWNQILVINFSE